MVKRLDGRRERSRLTRARIVGAATTLFVERGYLATTIEDIAAEADVAVQTVYYVFGTKPKVLAAVLDASIAGAIIRAGEFLRARSRSLVLRAPSSHVQRVLGVCGGDALTVMAMATAGQGP